MSATSARRLRVTWTLLRIIIVQTLVCGVALLPAMLLWHTAATLVSGSVARLLLESALLIPCYVVFALALLVVSPAGTRIAGARTPEDATLVIAELEWPLLKWVEYMVAAHVVRVFAGALFRGSPLWTAYMRLNGARIGRAVYVNSLSVSDHNLLDFGDRVVIGADVHLSGHTVEAGLLKTGGVAVGRRVTVGVGSVVEIDVTIGANAQIGALSFVPKHSRLRGGQVYVGVPAKPLPAADCAPSIVDAPQPI